MARASTSWTELSTHRTCPHKHHLQYVERWQSEQAIRPLEIGTLGHQVLDLHYRGIKEHGEPDVESIVALLKENGVEDDSHPRHEFAKVVLWGYHGYRKRWAAEDKERWRTERVEEEYRIEIPGTDGLVLVMRIDTLMMHRRMARDAGLWVWDHKWMKNLPNQKELDLDDQTALYVWGVRKAGFPVVGALLNVVRTERLKRAMTLEERFERYWLHKPDSEIETVLSEAKDTIATMDDSIRLGRHPRHTDTQNCKWRCNYVEACLAGRRAQHREAEILQIRGFRKRGPSEQVKLTLL